TVDLYASPMADPTGYGQGRQYLGAATLSSAADGNGQFSFSNPAVLPVGWFITATATDDAGDTSEFSQALALARRTLVVTNTSDAGAGSLRQAILDANAYGGPDTIDFAIPGTGTRTITSASALPT